MGPPRALPGISVLISAHTAEFSDLAGEGGGADVSAMPPQEWDPSGEYADVAAAVGTACADSALRVYRVERGSCRVSLAPVWSGGGGADGAAEQADYFLVGLVEATGKVVGLRVKAVES